MNLWQLLHCACVLCFVDPQAATAGPIVEVAPPPVAAPVYWLDFDPCPPCPPIICLPPAEVVEISPQPEIVAVAPPPAPLEEISPPALVLQVLVPADAEQGKEVEYCLCIENRSPSAAHHVVVHNPLPAHARFARADPAPTVTEPGLQWRLGTVHGGEKRIIKLWLAPTGSGDIQNCARITYEHGVCVTTKVLKPSAAPPAQEVIPQPPKPAPGVTESVGEAKLKLSKDAPKQQYMSVPIPYRLTVTNEGSAPARNVVVTDRLPAQSAFVSASENGQQAAGQVQWALGDLPPKATRTLELRVRATAPGEAINLAEAQADGAARVTAESRTQILGAAGLVIELVDIVDPVELGQETQYQVILRNSGTVPITNIRILGFLPDELTLVRAEAAVQYQKSDRQGREPEKIVFQPFTLPPGQDTVYRIFARAQKAGDARFRVELTADQLTAGPVNQEESTTVFNPRQP